MSNKKKKKKKKTVHLELCIFQQKKVTKVIYKHCLHFKWMKVYILLSVL